ncbi:TraR/DksA C4-type zinc finger protein [Halanaerobaculum tunisiense]
MGYNVDHYRQKLLQERKRILNQLANFAEKGYEGLTNDQRYSTGELSKYDNHPADTSNATFEREKDLGLKDNAQVILAMIDDALEEIETGQYGLCDYCGEEINSQRLDAIPYSTVCIECKSQIEEQEEISDRPIEEGTVNDYFDTGGQFRLTDATENIAFDGEDTWQALASVGTSNTPSDVPGAKNNLDSYIDAAEKEEQRIYEDRLDN